MARKPNPHGISRAQVLFPTPDKEWLETQARKRDSTSKAHGGHSVKISHLVTNAVEFYMAHPDLVDAWLRDRQHQAADINDELRDVVVRDALRFYRGNRKLARAYLKDNGA